MTQPKSRKVVNFPPDKTFRKANLVHNTIHTRNGLGVPVGVFQLCDRHVVFLTVSSAWLDLPCFFMRCNAFSAI